MAATALGIFGCNGGENFTRKVYGKVDQEESSDCLRIAIDPKSVDYSLGLNQLAILQVSGRGGKREDREVSCSGGVDGSDYAFRDVCTGEKMPLKKGTQVTLSPLPVDELIQRGQCYCQKLGIDASGLSRGEVNELVKILRSLEPFEEKSEAVNFIQMLAGLLGARFPVCVVLSRLVSLYR